MNKKERYITELCRHRRRTLFGKKLSQSFAAIYVLEQFLSNYKPTTIVELGTGLGVLSMYFQVYSSLSEGEFITLDVTPPPAPTGAFLCSDAYKEETVLDCCEMLNKGKRSFLFVDALDPKSNLVNLYSPLLKKNTVIAAHDAILTGNEEFRWGFTEDKINWENVERYGMYYDMSKELDTRTLYMKIKEN